jgi:hypothetical protein
VNQNTNLAAWMIGGGRRTIDPSEPEISPMAAPSMPPVAAAGGRGDLNPPTGLHAGRALLLPRLTST